MFITDIALITLFLLCIVDAVTLYEIRCPGRSEQRLLSKRCQNSIQFHCVLSAADGIYKSECRNREWVVKGNYPVRRGFRQYIDYEPCPIDRYQPFVFWSNEDHQCNILKSLCSEKGQAQYDNGTTTSDKRCNCDTASGYDFAVPPKNKRYCVSSEEDCSCLQKSCMDIHRQNADNNCARREMIETDTGSMTGQKKQDIKEEYNSTKQISRFRNTIHTKSEGRLLFGIAVFLIILTIMFGLMVIISVAFCGLELVCQGQHEKHVSKIDPVKRGKQLILSDIIILHSDEDFFKVRAIYKGHLTFIARQFGYNDVTIESFKDAFPSTEKIPLQEVIKHCRFLFFYVSEMSFPSKVATNGLNEKEINSVLNLTQKYIKYPSIKIVCACEHSSCNFSEIDLDYFNYKTDKTIRESYKETLKLILKSIKKVTE